MGIRIKSVKITNGLKHVSAFMQLKVIVLNSHSLIHVYVKLLPCNQLTNTIKDQKFY